MEILVKAFPKAKLNKIVEINKKSFKIYTTSPPEKDKANLAIIKILAEYFHLPKNKIILTRGQTSKNKIFILNDD